MGLLTFCRMVIGLTFAVSFGAKTGSVNQFAESIASFRVLSEQWAKAAAVLFLSGEAAVVLLMLVGGPWLAVGFGLSALLLSVFTLALISVLARKIQASCNCFGRSRKPVSWYDVGRNGVLIGFGLAGWWVTSQAQDGPETQNWMMGAWTGLSTIGEGNMQTTILAISAALTWLVLLLTILFVLLLAKRVNQLPQNLPKEHILKEATARRGQIAPPFEAQNLGGETVTLDTYKGKPVAFIFLSPSCKPCVERIPELNQYAAQANGMEIVAVNVDPHVSVADFAAEHALLFPVLSAPQVLNPFASDYGAHSTPSFCLVDAEQHIRASGHLDSRYWRDQLALMWK